MLTLIATAALRPADPEEDELYSATLKAVRYAHARQYGGTGSEENREKLYYLV